MPKTRPFLTAEWRYLAMLNYEIDPALLQLYVPAGTELDIWQGKSIISVVAFLFHDTRLMGLPIPYHTDFEEVNLRFYVRHCGPDGWRRGVVFVKELVPRRAIALAARLAYNENYAALPMRHTLSAQENELTVEYLWLHQGRWHFLRVDAAGAPQPLQAGSEAEFITEHYWGYARQRDGGTVEYRVEHPRWRIWPVEAYSIECDVARLYGPQFAPALSAEPTSVFLADGSPVAVYRGVRLTL